jgi:DNA-binding NtrC family response regulator
LKSKTATISRVSAVPPSKGTAPHLVVLLDAGRLREAPLRISLRDADDLRLVRSDVRRVARPGPQAIEIGLADPRVSSAHASLRREAGAWVVEDLGSKNGTLVDGRLVGRAELHDGALVEVGHTFLLFSAAALEGSASEATLSPGLAASLERLEAVAASKVPVVLRGESGTGKEVAARLVHRASRRRGPFVAVNCGALPANLIESELFGYRRGAFSGAIEDRPGLVRTADGGTLFLDEIGDLPLPAQAALLRVLQENEVLPVGGTRPVPVDLRLVCATHRDLQALAREERFRSDLLARISGFALELPPLRERREDLGLLIARLAPEGTQLAPDAARALLLYRWPLNVRELEHTLSVAAAVAKGGRIEVEHLPREVIASGRPMPAAPPTLDPADQRRFDELVALLREHDGNVTRVAQVMGKPRTQVQRWLRRFHIEAASYRKARGAIGP